MKKHLAAALALAVLPLVTLAPHASAAVTRVFPSGACPAGATGLTNCIALSAPGDTVKVKPGTFFENVVVSQDVTVRALDCTRRPVIDATTPAPTNAGPPGVRGIGFSVQAFGVTIDCFTIRHATIAVENGTATGFDDVRIRRLLTVDASTGVHSFAGGDNLVVTNNLIRDGDATGILIDGGTGLKLIGNRLRRMGDDCIVGSNVPAALIQNNILTRCADTDAVRINATSPGVQIIGNRVVNADSDGFDVTSDDGVIKGNTVTNAGDNAFEIDGSNVQVKNNVASGTFFGGYFDIGCDAVPCDDVLIQNNRGLGAALLIGMNVSITPSVACAVAVCVRILGNVIRSAQRDGFLVVGDRVLLQENTALANGRESVPEGNGFSVIGDGDRLVRNIAANNSIDGVMLQGNSGVIDGNRALDNVIDGIHVVSGSANLLDGNVALRNLGEGLENDGTSTTLIDNVSRKNRSDCAGDGTISVNSANNVCADGSTFLRPGSIEP